MHCVGRPEGRKEGSELEDQRRKKSVNNNAKDGMEMLVPEREGKEFRNYSGRRIRRKKGSAKTAESFFAPKGVKSRGRMDLPPRRRKIVSGDYV